VPISQRREGNTIVHSSSNVVASSHSSIDAIGALKSYSVIVLASLYGCPHNTVSLRPYLFI
jgi:hypothetical protein